MDILKLAVSQIAHHQISIIHKLIEPHIAGRHIGEDLILMSFFPTDTCVEEEIMHTFMYEHRVNDVIAG